MFSRFIGKIKLLLLTWATEDLNAPTRQRMSVVFWSIAISHMGMWVTFQFITPQPYENILIRIFLMTITAVFYIQGTRPFTRYLSATNSFAFMVWINLNVFSYWMNAKNGSNHDWLAYSTLTTALTFLLMQWYRAILACITGILFAWLFLLLEHDHSYVASLNHTLLFILFMLLSLSHALVFKGTGREKFGRALSAALDTQHHLAPNLKAMHRCVDGIRPLLTDVQPESSAKHLSSASKALNNNINNIDTYLDMLRHNAEFYQNTTELDTISAADLIESCLNVYPYSHPKGKKLFSFRLESDFSFKGNKKEWMGVIFNLMKNAKDNLYENSLHISPGDIKIIVRASRGLGYIAMQNHGAPIPAEHLPYVFKPFYSLGSGLGLGLSYCRRIVTGCGGRILIESDMLTGTVVKIYIPIDS